MKYFSLIFLCLVFNYSNGQSINSETSNSYQAYDNYFELTRESIYLHTNKSSYLRGENLWFQGYAYNRQTQNLNPETRNVELGIYDDSGNMISKKLYLVVEGLFKGQISIDSTFADGEYYLKAETHYMKNFNEDYTHLQKFEVIGSEKPQTKQSLKSYDLQVLPEGGHSVINCNSALAFKLINQNGLGIEFDAQILEDDKPIFDFKSNNFGHARANFKPKEDVEYSVVANLHNGEIIEKSIKNIKPFGYVLSVNNILPRQTIINVSSYFPESVDKIKNDLKLMVHQEGKRFDIPLEITSQNPNVSKSISKDQLFYGVNTITLMLNNKPIAERLIFNRSKGFYSDEDISVQVSSKTSDSISLSLSLTDYNKKSTLSVSVLPEKSISYVKNQNISSTFLLDPFVNGYIENKTYYFKNPDRLVDYNLDLLLMIQGWSKYDWDNIFNYLPNRIYDRKNGLNQNITLNGRPPRKAEKFLIHNTFYNSNLVFDLDSVQHYSLKNRYPFVGEQMKFSYVTNKKEFIEPNVIVSTPINLKKDSIDINLKFSNSIHNLRKVKPEFNSNILYSNFLDGELLDEVVVKAISEKEKDKIRKYGKFFADDVVEIDEKFVSRFPLLSNYIATQGYFVNDTPRVFSIRKISGRSARGRSTSLTPVVFLDGIRLTDLNFLSRVNTSDFEEILIDRSGFARGEQNDGGVIMLTSKKTSLYKKDEKLAYYTYELKNGFEYPKQFYMPKYAFFQTESFQQVGTIAWFADVTLKAEDTVELSVFDTGVESFKIFIEGIAEDGSLINIEKTVTR